MLNKTALKFLKLGLQPPLTLTIILTFVRKRFEDIFFLPSFTLKQQQKGAEISRQARVVPLSH